jgi:hypothetical protein
MRYYLNFLSLSLISVSVVTLALANEKKVSAIGCDTYYLVTGQIAGCTDVSTENAEDLWLQKYSICLDRQLEREISIYIGKLKTNHVQEKYVFAPNKIGNIWRQNTKMPFLSLSQNPATRYRGSADFCDRESK